MPNQEEFDDADLAQRRERGRLAQRAFRKRQIDTIRELREDNQALREAIDLISRAAATGPNSHARQAELQTAIENAFRVAGLDPGLAKSLADSGEEYDDDMMAGPSGPHGPMGLTMDQTAIDYSPGGPFYSATPVSSQLVTTTQAMAPLYSQQPMSQPLMYSQLVSAPSPPRQTPLSSSGRMSPRMTYGLWFEPGRNIRIVHTPHDIVPYVGDGMRSLAGAIFWTGMGYSLSALRTILNARFRGIVIDPDAPSSDEESDDGGDGGSGVQEDDRGFSSGDFSHLYLRHRPVGDGSLIIGGRDDHDDDELDEELTRETKKANPAGRQTHRPPDRTSPPHRLSRSQKEKLYRRRVRKAQRFIAGRFGPTLRLVSDQAAFDIIHARFVFRNRGWIAGDHPGRDPEAPMRLFAAILRDMEHTTAFGDANMWIRPVEIQTYVQQRLRLTPSGWAPWEAALQGSGSPVRMRMLGVLLDKIIMSGMCFGDGPRWRIEAIESMVEDWINGVAAGVEGVGVWC